MTQCEYCQILEGTHTKSHVLYQNEKIIVAIKDKVATPGQITIFPKKHLTILEMIPPDILEECAKITNKVSIAAFEGLGSQGTNIVIRNGLGAGQDVPHFGIEIIPRQESDGINLDWKPKKMMEDEMDRTAGLLQEAIEESKKEKPKTPKLNKDIEVVEEEEKSDNYLLKSVRRIP